MMNKGNKIVIGVVVVIILIIGLYLFIEPKKEKVNVYLFWGDGCRFCASAKEFFNNENSENSKYYNLVTYEVWYDQEGRNMMQEVAGKLGVEVRGIPFIVIGDKYFSGYSSGMNDKFNEAIMSCYESQDCIDIMKE